jgi:hypothetical protein
MHHNRYRHRGWGRQFRRRFPNAEELLTMLEEHQRDLEQEVADVADLIRRLKESGDRERPASV